MTNLAQQDASRRDAGPEGLAIRKWFAIEEATHLTELGQRSDGAPVRKLAVAAVIANPYAGTFGDDLSDVIALSEALGQEFALRLNKLAAGDAIESYGKGFLVGTAGSYEHGNAFLTTVFANPVRDAVGGGLAWVPSTGKRAGPGVTIDVPLAHKDALYVRSHYDTFSLSFTDAPAPDEVVVIFVAATRGRLHARLGGIAAADIEGKDGLR